MTLDHKERLERRVHKGRKETVDYRGIEGTLDPRELREYKEFRALLGLLGTK